MRNTKDDASSRPGSACEGYARDRSPTPRLWLGGSVDLDEPHGARVTASATAAAEYDYLAGPILLRVSHTLTPFQAAQYQAALDKITGARG